MTRFNKRKTTNLQKIYINSYKHDNDLILRKFPNIEFLLMSTCVKVYDNARPFYNKDYYIVAKSFNELDSLYNNYYLHQFISYDIETNQINKEESYALSTDELKKYIKRLSYGIYILDIKYIKKLKGLN